MDAGKLEVKKSSQTWPLTSFVVISILFVFLTAYTKYIFAKDYSFYIEGECDPLITTCFVRDCDEYCPPNGLEIYSAYYIDASEFTSCTSNDCASICENLETAHLCEQIACDSNNYECTE
jgi:hypothetical protein